MNANDMQVEGAVLHVLRGLPRSGKSTLSRKLSAEFGNIPIVSRDSIRLALHGKPFVEELEPTVHKIATAMVKALLFSGHRDIIIDECNLRAADMKQLRRLADGVGVMEYCSFTLPDECKRRAVACGQDYLIPVIDRMASHAEDKFKAAWEGYSVLESETKCKARLS